METVKTRKQLAKLKKGIEPAFFLTPYLLFFFVFFIIPFVFGLVISFYDWDLFFPDNNEFVRFGNYVKVLFDKESIFYEYFWSGLKNTLIFVVISVPLLVVIPLFFAILIDMEPPGYKIFRIILFMPTIFSISAVILIWKWQFYSNGGFINSVLKAIGLNEIPFLTTQPWAWISILIVTIWWTMGTNMVILGAGLKNIDKTLYEAAAIDGANYFQTLIHISLPALTPQLLIVIITTIIASFNIYGQPDMLTLGGPNFSTTVLMMRIRGLAIDTNANPGIASTMAICMGIIMVVVSICQAKLTKKLGEE